jgi:hypothetical protein
MKFVLESKIFMWGNKSMKFLSKTSVAALVVGMAASSASASVIVSILQNGTDVDIVASGSLDLSGASAIGSNNSYGVGVIPGGINWYIAPGSGGANKWYGLTGTTLPFGTSTTFNTSYSSASGDNFFIWGQVGGAPTVGVDDAYVSGDSIYSELTYSNITVADLGFLEGSYLFSLPGDTITVNIGVVTAAVPLPAGLPLLLAGVMGFAAFRRKA